MTTIDEQIKIIQAYKEGKTIQMLKPITLNWEDIHSGFNNQFDFCNYDYRIKPDQEEEAQQDPVKTREIGYEFIKEQITKALEPILKPEELQREIKSAVADAVEKYIKKSDEINDKIRDWVQDEINEDEDLKDNIHDHIQKIAEDEINNHLSINIQLD